MCELCNMKQSPSPLAIWRKEQGLTLEGAAEKFGISSKGYLSEIEKGARCSVSIALEIERVTGIPAASLNPDVALVELARGLAA